MKRKLIQISNSTNVISIPTYWLKKNNLKKGDELNLEESNNALLITKTITKRKKTATINIAELEGDIIWLVIDAYYMQGYDEIAITTKDQKQKDLFIKIVTYFPGLIIDEDGKNYIKLKNIAKQEEFDLNSIINRIKNLTITIIQDSLDAIKINEWDTLKNIKKRDYVLNTYVSMAFRELNNNADKKTLNLGQYVKLLEMYADKMCIYIKKIGDMKQKDEYTQRTLKKILDLYKKHSILINKFDFNKLMQFEKERQDLLKKTKKEDANTQDILQLFYDIEEIATQINIE